MDSLRKTFNEQDRQVRSSRTASDNHAEGDYVRDDAKRDLRLIDRGTAMRVLYAIDRFALIGEGDVKRLQNVEPAEMRLRAGDYCIRFYDSEVTMVVLAVKHRREAYR